MKLPPKVHEKNGRYYYVHRNRWHGLSRVSEGETAMREALQGLLSPSPRTFGDLFDQWLTVPHDLRPVTAREYRRIVEGRLSRHFGRMALGTLQPDHVAAYLEKRGGVKANREIAVLSTVCAWAMRRQWLRWNPCHGVRRNRERPRRYYITDQELELALERAPAAVRDIMEAAYLTGLRQGDLRALRRFQLDDTGIHVQESKRERRIVIQWSPPLRLVVQRALARSAGPFVFTNSRGEAWTLSGLQTAITRLGLPWTFHDLRAKAESDHATGLGLMARYQRARILTPVR
jgi:integrase